MTDLIEKTLRRLGEQLPGQLSMPGGEGYTAATSLWAKPVNRTPRVVVRCQSSGDVQSAIRAARDCDLPLSVRGGGHDWAGRALCNGVVIDLSGMNSVSADPVNRTARILGGALTRDVAAATDPLCLAAVSGSVGAVGMAGLTLGGGYGALIGRFGLALDNLSSAEVVLADGRILTAGPDSDPDLLWALRGGGGNFGVVTAMQHRLHDLPSVCSGLLVYPFSEAKTVLDRCADIADSAPDELTVQVGVVAAPDGAPVVFILPTWCGSVPVGEARIAPFLKLGTLLAGSIGTTSYGASLGVFDSRIVYGQRTFMETCWIPAFDGASRDTLIEAMKLAVSPGCAIVTHEFKGAASRVPVEATAFGLRRDHVLIEIIASVVDPSDPTGEQRHQQWAQAVRRAFDGVALPGGYPNLLAEGDAERAAQSYGGNAQRLIKAKRKYDPDNIFRSVIPLPPSSAQS